MKWTGGEWKIRTTIDDSGDYPFPTYDIIAVFPYGPKGIGTAYQDPFNAELFMMSKKMAEAILEWEESVRLGSAHQLKLFELANRLRQIQEMKE